MKKILLLLTLLLSYNSMAQTDLTASAFYRTDPKGGGLIVDGGYSFPLWGGGDLMYGYFRPGLKVQTAGTYNSINRSFSIFPISFIGIIASRELANNSADYDAYDCATYTCQGTYDKNSLEGRFLYGYKILKGKVSYEYMDVKMDDATTSFVEPTFCYSIASTGGYIKTFKNIALLNVYGDYHVTHLYQRATLGSMEEKHTFNALGVMYKGKPWTFFSFVGKFKSPLANPSTTIIIGARYQFKEGLGL